MTTFSYTLKLDDSDAITLLDALSMLANANEINAARARQLIERINEEAAQTSGNSFNLLLTEEQLIMHYKTDFFNDK